MKKVLLVFICLLLLVGCKEDIKTESKENTTIVEEFKIEKIDASKDYVYLSKYKEVFLGGENYLFEYPVINIKGDNIDNVNLELKSFIINSYKEATINDGRFVEGKVINHKYYVTDKYISIVETYYEYIDGIVGEKFDNVYVVSLDTGKVVDNSGVLNSYNYTEDDFYALLENTIESDDIPFTLMNIKSNGYKLYIDNDDKLNIIYYEVTNDEEIRKELVLN